MGRTPCKFHIGWNPHPPLERGACIFEEKKEVNLKSRYVNGCGSITSVGEERANLSAVVCLLLCVFCLERFPLPLGAWDGLRYFIVALPEPSI